MAIEDAAALEVLMSNIAATGEVPKRLEMFDTLRLPRVRATQTFSNNMLGPPGPMIQEVKKYYRGPIPGPTAKTFSPEFCDFFFSYDVQKEAAEVLLK